MKNIFILTEGGGILGMGHISRCLSLYQALVRYNYRPLMIINGENSILNILKGINVVFLNWTDQEKQLFSLLKNPDLLIIDSYLCSLNLYNKLASISRTIAYIDDDIRVDYPKGYVLNGIMNAEKMNYPKNKDIVYLLGHEYAFLRQEFWEVPEKIINREIKSVLITLGGNDKNGLSYRILKSLTDEYPLIEKLVILKSWKTPYLNYFKQNSTLLFNLSALEMRSLMTSTDIAITASGQTTYELCRIGMPFIAIITVENQTFSINSFYEHGLVSEPIYHDDPNMNIKIIDQFKQLSDYYLRIKIHKKMKKIISGMGSLNVVEHLLQNNYINNN